MRTLEQLKTDNPSWPLVTGWIAASPHPVEVLEASQTRSERCLVSLQVTDRSVLGALALNTGGILVDHGWLRLLGGGSTHLDGLADANSLSGDAHPSGPLLVAHDVLGGRFVINDGTLPGEPGEVDYWAPDTLRWEPLEAGHSALVQMALSERLDQFYRGWRWDGWEVEVVAVDGHHGLALYPPPFTTEGQDLVSTNRAAVPFAELVAFYDDVARQLDDGAAE